MPLLIPSQHKAVISKVSRLTGKERTALLEALAQLEVGPLSFERLAKDLAQRTSFSEAESDDLVSVIANLHSLSLAGALDEEQVVPEVIRAVESDAKLALTKTQVLGLRQFLRKVLSLSTLGVLSKALYLYAGHERLLSKAVIFSDLRPVFEEEVADPLAFVVSHTLRLTVHRPMQRESEDVYITLDKSDLGTLKEVLDRAFAKQASLERVSAVTGVPILTPE